MNASETVHAIGLERLFPKSGKSGAIEDFAWAKTPLGPPENWSANLRAAISDAMLGGVRESAIDEPAAGGVSAGEPALDRVGSQTPFMLARCGRDLRYRYVSGPYAELVGRAPEEIVGRTIREILGPDGFQEIQPYIETVLAGNTARFEGELPLPGVGSRRVRAVYRPDRDAAGRVIGWLASVTDLTDQQRIEDATRRVQAMRAETESVLENMSGGLILVDAQWQVTYVNAATEKLQGLSRAKMIGCPLWELLPRKVGTLAEQEYRRAMLQRVSVKFECPSDLDHRWFEHEGHPIIGGGLALYARDVTVQKAAAAALKKSEEEFRAFFEFATVGAAQVDVATKKYLRVNRRYCEMLGYSPEEMSALSFVDLTHPDERAESLQVFGRLLRGEVLEFSLEKRLRRKDGSWIWAHVTVSVTRDAAGQPLRTVAVIHDITERKRIEQARLESEARLSAIFAQAAAGLSEISLEGRFERVNDELCRMLGRTRQEIRSIGMLEVIHPDDSVKTLTAIARLVQTGEAARLDQRYVRPDGTVIWANSIITRLDDEAGRPRALLAVTIDLTHRREAEAALRTSEERLRALVTASSHVLFRMSSDWAEMRELRSGVSPIDTPPNRTWLQDHVDPEDQPKVRTAIEQARKSGAIFESEHRARRPGGTIAWAFWRAVPLRNDAREIIEWFGVACDVSERRLAQEALHASAERLRRATEIETVGIAFFQENGAITEANGAFLRMSGYTRAEIAGGLLRWDCMTPPEWMPATLKAIEEFKSLGRTMPYEKESIRKDGGRWWGLFAASRLGAEGEGVEYVIDITERKSAEAELLHSRQDLELRVQERTAEVDAVNGALRDEIVEREQAEQGRQDLLRQLVVAQEEERRRISRELHDEIGQDLSALMLGLKAIGDMKDRATIATTLTQLQRIAERVGGEVHEMALKLRPTALDDLGLLRTLSNYVEEWSSRSRVEVDFHSSGWTGERLPSHVETTLYRIVQEALNNVVKHASATRVSVIIERRADQVVAIVEDNGVGFDLATVERTGGKRLGLLGMTERAALVDGHLSVESSEHRGTTVFVRVPLPPPPPGSRFHDQATYSPR